MFASIKTLKSRVYSPRVLRGAVVLTGVLGLSTLTVQLASAQAYGSTSLYYQSAYEHRAMLERLPSQAPASAGLHYQRGYYVTNGWYCLGWSNGTYRCTQRWHRKGSHIISDSPNWVPNGGTTSQRAGKSGSSSRVSYHLSGPNPYPWGQCTWYARSRGGAELNGLGNAKDWFRNAQRRGLPTGYTPRVGATVVLQPGVHGTSYLGHVGHVEKVYGGGSFLMSDMNWGGFGVVTYHVMNTGPGVSFIY